VSIVIGVGALVVGAIMRCVPDRWFEWLWIKLRIMRDPNELPSVAWNPALDKIRDNLTTFQKIRGGRMRGSALVMKSKTAQLEKNDIQLYVVTAYFLRDPANFFPVRRFSPWCRPSLQRLSVQAGRRDPAARCRTQQARIRLTRAQHCGRARCNSTQKRRTATRQ